MGWVKGTSRCESEGGSGSGSVMGRGVTNSVGGGVR